MKFVLLLSAIYFTSTQAFAVDSNFEKRMHDIYKSSYSLEVPDQDWANFVEKIDDNTYSVKAGDTLWSLSKVFFGDGFFWSKIWSYNGTLTNPHMISIGSQIQFFSGSANLPPSMGVNGQSMNQSTINITRPGEAGLYPGAPDLPETVQELTPVLNQIPPAFRAKVNYAGTNQFDSQGMSFDLRPAVRVNPLFVVPAFLHDGSASSYPKTGEIFEAEDGNISMGTRSRFYFESEKAYQVGDVVTVMGKDYDFSRMGVTGDVILYMGKATVTDVLEDEEYRAEIDRAISPITLKRSFVTDEEIPAFPDDLEGRPNSTVVDVVGGALENEREYLAKSSVIFLDGGSDEGIRVGDIMGVYKVRKYRYSKYDVDVSPTPIAHIKVFRSEEDVASAFVVESTEAIVPGDRTGPPQSVTGTISKAEQSDLNSVENDLEIEEDDEDFDEDEEDFGEEESLEDELEEI